MRQKNERKEKRKKGKKEGRKSKFKPLKLSILNQHHLSNVTFQSNGKGFIINNTGKDKNFLLDTQVSNASDCSFLSLNVSIFAVSKLKK